jgi:hypothetical protein
VGNQSPAEIVPRFVLKSSYCVLLRRFIYRRITFLPLCWSLMFGGSLAHEAHAQRYIVYVPCKSKVGPHQVFLDNVGLGLVSRGNPNSLITLTSLSDPSKPISMQILPNHAESVAVRISLLTEDYRQGRIHPGGVFAISGHLFMSVVPLGDFTAEHESLCPGVKFG